MIARFRTMTPNQRAWLGVWIGVAYVASCTAWGVTHG